MRSAKVYYKKEHAGTLIQQNNGTFLFKYTTQWLQDDEKPPVSLTLPKSEYSFESPFLFAFFYNMLPEGTNKKVICKKHKIDLDDHFGLLLTTAKFDTIGAVQVIENPE